MGREGIWRRGEIRNRVIPGVGTCGHMRITLTLAAAAESITETAMRNGFAREEPEFSPHWPPEHNVLLRHWAYYSKVYLYITKTSVVPQFQSKRGCMPRYVSNPILLWQKPRKNSQVTLKNCKSRQSLVKGERLVRNDCSSVPTSIFTEECAGHNIIHTHQQQYVSQL
jgi:hypothetical protein